MLSDWRRQGEGRLPSQRGAAAGTDAHGRARSHKTWRAMSTDSCCRRRPCPDAMAANCTTGMSGGLVGDGADSTYRRWTEGSASGSPAPLAGAQQVVHAASTSSCTGVQEYKGNSSDVPVSIRSGGHPPRPGICRDLGLTNTTPVQSGENQKG